MAKISIVVNTRNEERNIKRCLKSIQWADEIVVVDQHSKDRTVEIAKKLGAKVYSHRHTLYVEPARNFALSKAISDWILVLDADEEIPPSLVKKLKTIAKENKVQYVRLPRKNIIFGQWMKHSRWWPDYNIRFFQKGKVTWSDKIHRVPLTRGEGRDLEAKEKNAVVHCHYQSISQYLERVNRYTDIQAKELIDSGYKFAWQDFLKKPTGEFLSRFFAGEGYKDGIHGLVLALLQMFSELVKYLKVWEKQGFKAQELPFSDFLLQMKKLGRETSYWLTTSLIKEAKGPLRKLRKVFLKLKRKLLS